MKKFLIASLLILSQVAFAQDKGIIKGLVTDKETNNEPLPFANVFIKGTSIGVTTDFDGNYTLSVPAGNQTIVFSFLGYKTVEKSVTITAGQTITINQVLGAEEGVSLDEVVIKSSSSKETVNALILEQKKATVIKESIGAERLKKIGVSNAANATTKISGVTKSEGTGDIYIRGLGDRYLSTTMNRLTIPSDDVSNKNINLNLFSTNIIKNVGISKTYDTSSYADQGSGNVDVNSKEYSKKGYSISLSSGTNTNILKLDNDFRTTLINNDVTFGFHQKKYALQNLITFQGWDTETQSTPINFSGSFSAARKFEIFGKQLSIFLTGSHSKTFNHFKGVFKSYRSNVLNTSYNDAEQYNLNSNTTGYINVGLKLNDNHKIKYNTLFVNTGTDNLYEQGRDGLGYVFDQDPQENGAFVRDQNFKQTTLFVNQLMGEHKLNENNTLNWAGGYNFVLAEEPNRIRNEVNILDIASSPTIQYAHVGDFQQRKSSQKIEDQEVNAFIENKWKLGFKDEDDNKPYSLNYGINFRNKERKFRSNFVGVRAKGFTAPSIDELSSTFTSTGFNNGLDLKTRETDRYQADLNILAAYANFDFKFDNNLSGNLGLRFEKDKIDIIWDVANFVGRIGTIEKNYESLYPSVNLKYELNENTFLRFASSITQTLPEFKELAPFEYVSPTGRVIAGNQNLEKSEIYNLDLKYEMFPQRGQLFSATAFYKQINNPINLALSRGSSGYFSYFNTGEKANIYGLEIEARSDLIKNEDDQSILNITGNITKMWLSQDLLEDFQYKNTNTSSLQGASDFIVNGSLSFNNNKEKEFIATLTGNYSSDKIFALGSPEDKTNSATLYNDEIIEKGFVSLDLVMSKKITKNLSVKFVGRNLINPNIKQTQLVRNLITNIETNETVLSYKKGSQLNLSFNYKF
ncbi:outer membrane receptor protein involved in Fe transport [Lutibacter sp. Hel_I_33_5]|uniref:TonB-dependent receptor n=1 Tax=Lutibacter sp. Hel_I_33_5 TaxID=1566289 RepID=UPI0011A1104E|nr:TonB-dependent receptor [Lutibacter sp. Hel_I_33_5]TVZ56618.1 outer membrane receptor protein involved in Fe transport [Lutibacter sp. Hel_I_33_5]